MTDEVPAKSDVVEIPADQAASFAAFQQWQASQAAGQSVPSNVNVPVLNAPQDERVQGDFFDALKHIVSLAPVATEAVRNSYHDLIDDFRNEWNDVLTAVKTGRVDTTGKANDE